MSGILKMFQTVTAPNRTSSRNSRITRSDCAGVAGYSPIHDRKMQSRGEVERKLNREVTFVLIEPTA